MHWQRLNKDAYVCHSSIQNAFLLRHKLNPLQAAQQKTESLSDILHAELAKRGKAPAAAWQQQRLQLRPISQPNSPRSSNSGSPVGGQRYTDASIDTLMQQRAKLKHVQTSSKGLVPGGQSAVSAMQQRQPNADTSEVPGSVRPPVPNQGQILCC